MEQISNRILVDAIDQMKKTPEFLKFIKGCEKRLKKLDKAKTFSYRIKNTAGKTVTVNVDFRNKVSMSKYVELLKDNISDIITCDFKSFNDWGDKFSKIDFGKEDQTELSGFFAKILTVLQYKTLRSGDDKLLFKFYQKLKVKACVYCNSQHVILLQSSKIARLQADHNLPKAKFPCFSVTLANLYPSCNNCNHLKKEFDVKHYLYFLDKPKREISFSLKDTDIIDFYTYKLDEDKLKIEFDQGSTQLEKILNISQIYNNHTDYVVDLLRKHRIYKKSYVSNLISSFGPLLGNNEDLVNRMIFGSNFNDEDINQRVFSKLLNDVKRQLDELDYT